MDIKDKIQKLLALSDNPNEHEAQAALLKAQELMAKHKLSMHDFETKTNAKVVRYNTGLTCSKRKDPWIVQLANSIAPHYCCKMYRSKAPHKHTVTVFLVGFPEDAQACTDILKYAIMCINNWICRHEKTLPLSTDAYTRRSIHDSYAYGYIRGMRTVMEQQRQKHQEWGLALVVPPEAQEIISKMKTENFQGNSVHIASIYNQGFVDGTKFSPHTELSDKSAV